MVQSVQTSSPFYFSGPYPGEGALPYALPLLSSSRSQSLDKDVCANPSAAVITITVTETTKACSHPASTHKTFSVAKYLLITCHRDDSFATVQSEVGQAG